MKKQKKQMISLILLCLVLAVGIAAFFALRAYNERQAAIEAARTSGGDYSVTDLDSAAIDGLTVENGQGTMNFSLKDGTWYDAEDESLAMKQSTITAMVNKVCDLKGVDIIENVTDFDQYGLAEPRMRVTASGGGAALTLLIGDTNTAVNRTYVCVEGETTVYTTGTSVETQFDHTIEELIEEPEEEEGTEEASES